MKSVIVLTMVLFMTLYISYIDMMRMDSCTWMKLCCQLMAVISCQFNDGHLLCCLLIDSGPWFTYQLLIMKEVQGPVNMRE